MCVCVCGVEFFVNSLAIARAVIRHPVTAEAQVRSRVGFVVERVTLGQGFLRVLPPMLYTHLHLHVALNNKDKRACVG